MGNPETLRHPPGGPPIDPPRNRVVWMVYQLRQAGEKLPSDLVLRTGKTGRLELLQQQDGQLRGRLLKDDGVPIASLWDARVVRHDDRGLLLHGCTLNDEPQAWWCLVHSVEPLPPDGAVS